MGKSISYLMEYSRGNTGLDRFGGLPSHLPHNWPRCQCGQERLAFMGQIYACDWFPLNGLLCLQFYTCVRRCLLDVDLLHVELVHPGAPTNRRCEGVANPDLPVRTINYFAVEDSLDHGTFLGMISGEDPVWPVLKDEHLYSDRLGGIYTFDGTEGPVIDESNRCIGQFQHPCIRRETIYLYESTKEGIYAHTYR